MNHWIFQGNPDKFDIDSYLINNAELFWPVRQKHLAKEMRPGDDVFIWKASGSKNDIAGIVAKGIITGRPEEMNRDAATQNLLSNEQPEIELMVPLRIKEMCLDKGRIVKRKWLEDDPIVSNIRILKFHSETNYLIGSNEAERIAALVRNTGRNWKRPESIAGMWAYANTINKPVSRVSGTPVADVALTIGRAVTGVYNKVMNFRAIDPNDSRSGLSAGGHSDIVVWEEFFDEEAKEIRIEELNQEYNLEELNQEYNRLWGRNSVQTEAKKTYLEYGDAPNDDPNELQQFAAKVRRGQPAFRKNLLAAYNERCSLTGYRPAEVLEAVHLIPHAESGINEIDNGLLIRGDLHSLFDANLLRINPDTLTIVIDEKLSKTPYWKLNGKTIFRRADGTQISSKYLKQRWDSKKEA